MKLPLSSPIQSRTEDDADALHQDKFDSEEEVALLQKNQLPTPKFCLLTACAVLQYLISTTKKGGNNVKLNQVRFLQLGEILCIHQVILGNNKLVFAIIGRNSQCATNDNTNRNME